jgi:hypothetical protein
VCGCLGPDVRACECLGPDVRACGSLSPGVRMSGTGCPGVRMSGTGCPGVRMSRTGCPGVRKSVPGCAEVWDWMSGCADVWDRMYGCAEVCSRVCGCRGLDVRACGCRGLDVRACGCLGPDVRVCGSLFPGVRMSGTGCPGVRVSMPGCWVFGCRFYYFFTIPHYTIDAPPLAPLYGVRPLDMRFLMCAAITFCSFFVLTCVVTFFYLCFYSIGEPFPLLRLSSTTNCRHSRLCIFQNDRMGGVFETTGWVVFSKRQDGWCFRNDRMLCAATLYGPPDVYGHLYICINV